MRSVQDIDDPDMLRQVAVLLERENATLHAKLHALAEELARLRGDTTLTPQHELAFLKELLAQRERPLFGASYTLADGYLAHHLSKPIAPSGIATPG